MEIEETNDEDELLNFKQDVERDTQDDQKPSVQQAEAGDKLQEGAEAKESTKTEEQAADGETVNETTQENATGDKDEVRDGTTELAENEDDGNEKTTGKLCVMHRKLQCTCRYFTVHMQNLHTVLFILFFL